MPAFIFKHEEESPIIKLMMNVVILKMVFRGRGRATRGAERRMGAFTPGSPPSAPQAHNIPDLRPRQIPWRTKTCKMRLQPVQPCSFQVKFCKVLIMGSQSPGL